MPIQSALDYLSYSYAPNSNRLNQLYENVAFTQKTDDAESTGFTYDKNGNVISGDGTSSILYDLRNLPTQIVKNGQTLRYRYNSSGQRIYKDGTSGKEHYLMNGSELIAVWKEGAGLQYWQTSYGRYQPTQGTYTSYYYVKDHLGSTRVVLNEAGQRTEATDYYAFGMKMGGRSYYQGTKDGYTTKERDAETGWDYFGARYYNPSIARWMNVDPLSDKYPNVSPYNYVMNMPLQIVDPNGKEVCIRLNANTCLKYENGQVYNADGSVYEGDATIVKAAVDYLSTLAETKAGKQVIDNLVSASDIYKISDEQYEGTERESIHASYSFAERKLKIGRIVAEYEEGGVSIAGFRGFAHELYHAFEHANGANRASINGEVEARIFTEHVGGLVVGSYHIFGKNNTSGGRYQAAMEALTTPSQEFSAQKYRIAIINFKNGSHANEDAIYSRYPVLPIPRNPLIKQFYPLQSASNIK